MSSSENKIVPITINETTVGEATIFPDGTFTTKFDEDFAFVETIRNHLEETGEPHFSWSSCIDTWRSGQHGWA